MNDYTKALDQLRAMLAEVGPPLPEAIGCHPSAMTAIQEAVVQKVELTPGFLTVSVDVIPIPQLPPDRGIVGSTAAVQHFAELMAEGERRLNDVMAGRSPIFRNPGASYEQ